MRKVIKWLGLLNSFIVGLSILSSCSLFNFSHEAIFKNYDDTILYSTTVSNGADVVYNGDTPTKPKDNSYYYTFNGWDKDTTNIKDDTVFFATYSSKHWYTLSFFDYTGNLIHTQEWVEGTDFVYMGKTPDSYDDGTSIYVFNGWGIDFNNVKSNLSVYGNYAIESFVKGNLDYTYELLDDGTYMITGSNDSSSDGCMRIPSHFKGKRVTAIEESAFSSLTWIKKVVLGDNITTLSKYLGDGTYCGSFNGCTNLSNIVFNDKLTDIGDWTFSYCISLKRVELFGTFDPSILAQAFIHCSNLEELSGGNKLNCKIIDNVVYSNDFSSLYYYPAGQNNSVYKIHKNVKTICKDAFAYTTKLKKIVFNDELETLEDESFYLSSVEEICFNQNLQYIGESAFYRSMVAELIIPDSVVVVDGFSFTDTPLKSIHIGKGTRYLSHYWKPNPGGGSSCSGNSPFQGLANLSEITIDDENQYFEMRNDCLVYKETGKVVVYPCKKHNDVITLKNGAEAGAFSYADVDTVYLYESKNGYGTDLFRESKIKNAYFCEGFEKFDLFNTLYLCYELKSILIPSSALNLSNYTGSYFFENLNDIDIFYGGTSIDELNKISMGSGQYQFLMKNNLYYYSSSKVSGCWRYLNNVPTLW